MISVDWSKTYTVKTTFLSNDKIKKLNSVSGNVLLKVWLWRENMFPARGK